MRKLIIVAALFVAGCATQILQSYVGKDVSEAVLDYGPPYSVVDLPDGTRAFQWSMTSTNTVPATTYYSGSTYGNQTYGTFNTVGGGTYSQTCVYTLLGKKNPRGSYTVVDFRPPSFACE